MAPSVVGAECGDDGRTEEAYYDAGLRREKEVHEGLLGGGGESCCMLWGIGQSVRVGKDSESEEVRYKR